jgi:hypothetical protein
MGKHQDLDTTDLHKPGYVQSSDPGAVGAGKQWIDTSGGTGNWVSKIRNATNSGWESVSGGGGFFDAIFTAKGSFSAASGGSSDYVDWDVEIKKDTGFTHSTGTNPEQITLDDAGWYLILLQVGGEKDGSESQDISIDVMLEVDDGGGFDPTYSEIFLSIAAANDGASGMLNHLIQTTGSNWKLRVEVANDGDASYSFDGSNSENRITVIRLA